MSDSTFSFDRQWPYRPDFNQFKRQAKELLKAYRAGDANAVAEVQRHEQAPDPTAFALHDAQRVLARSYGFTSWQKLKSYVQTIQPYWRRSNQSLLMMRTGSCAWRASLISTTIILRGV